MPIRVDLDLLSPNLREVWVVVPCDRADPDKGYASVKIKELPKKDWDMIWIDLSQREKAWFTAQKENGAPLTVAEAGEAARERHRDLLRRCVIDHDPADFPVEVEPLEPTDPNYPALLSRVIASGFSSSEAVSIIKNGGGNIPFNKDSFVELYERLSPDRDFVVNLAAILARFHAGEIVHAVDFWLKSKVPEKKIPPHLLKKSTLRMVSK